MLTAALVIVAELSTVNTRVLSFSPSPCVARRNRDLHPHGTPWSANDAVCRARGGVLGHWHSNRQRTRQSFALDMSGGSTMEVQGIEAEATNTNVVAENDLTMDDVVAAATIEIERQQQMQQQQLMLQLKQEQQKTHFEWFEEHDNARIAESEKVALDRLVMDDQGTDSDTDSRTKPRIHASEIVSWNHLKALLARGLSSPGGGDDAGDRDERSALYRQLEDSGGYVVVELDDETASIVEDMWATMEDYFSLPETEQQVDRQVLEKSDGSHDPQAGYLFRQTYVNKDGIVLPETIQDALGGTPRSHNGVSGSFHLFAEMCKTVGTLVAAGALGKDPRLVHKVVTSLLDEKSNSGHPFVNAEHRLSRYIVGPEDANAKKQTASSSASPSVKESLISHTDWTFATCIPLSAIPGLQLWKPETREWIVPEAEELLAGDSRTRSRYVVVMAGKWMELLTNRAVSSCVHRVVTRPTSDGAARLSAPFFCRTKKYVFEMVRSRFGEDPTTTDLSQEEALDEMGKLFGDLVRFTEGSRDPDIPGCVLDVCMERGDCVPGCYSVEDVLC